MKYDIPVTCHFPQKFQFIYVDWSDGIDELENWNAEEVYIHFHLNMIEHQVQYEKERKIEK